MFIKYKLLKNLIWQPKLTWCYEWNIPFNVRVCSFGCRKSKFYQVSCIFLRRISRSFEGNFRDFFFRTFQKTKIGIELQLRRTEIDAYHNYWNRSRPCIILDSKIPRLVFEAFPKVVIFQQFFLDQNIQKGSNRLILKDLNFC